MLQLRGVINIINRMSDYMLLYPEQKVRKFKLRYENRALKRPFANGITLFKTSAFPQQIGIVIGNLTNTLYSEFSNAGFFRPAPRRNVVLTWSTRF